MVPTTLVVDLATHAWVITINKFVKINHKLIIRVDGIQNLELSHKNDIINQCFKN